MNTNANIPDFLDFLEETKQLLATEKSAVSLSLRSALKINGLEDHPTILFGLGKEGLSTYRFLRQYFTDTQILLVDDKERATLSEEWQNILTTDPNVSFSHNFDAVIDQKPILFKTPGIPLGHPLLAVAKEWHITSNTDLFFYVMRIFGNKKVKTIGITGTKGKSTTTALTHHILQTAGKHVFLGGNIGVPALDLMPQILDNIDQLTTANPAWVVLELSCHQLYDLHSSPNIAVVLEITPEHLDYYPDFETYVMAKSNIASHQWPTDWVMYNPNHAQAASVAARSAAKRMLLPSSEESLTNKHLLLDGKPLLSLDSLPLVGAHNIQNVLAAVHATREAGIDTQTIALACSTFKPLRHRLEKVAQVQSISFYNDSLSTTPVATTAALQSFAGQPIVLIAGGYDRGLEYDELAEAILNHKVLHLTLFPDTGERILSEVRARATTDKPAPTYTMAKTMQEAVTDAFSHAQKASNGTAIVLMSPASASFNLFADYADRGQQFCDAVLRL